MQCTSYIPVYRSRDLTVNSSGFSWHLLYTNYGEENGYNIPSQPLNTEHFLSHDKDVLRQIIQNHDSTFRHQVQELHRLYRKQRELMNEMRVKNFFPQCLSSQTTSESNHSNISHATATIQDGIFPKNGSCYSVKCPFPSFKSNGNRHMPLDLDLPTAVCHDDERIQFRDRKFSPCKPPENVPKIGPATVDLSSFNSNNKKDHFLIDLNLPFEAVPQSVHPNDSGFHNCNSKSDGRYSSVVIDLNSMPLGCTEAEMNPEHISTTKKETPLENPLAEIIVKPDINLNTNIAPNEPSTPTCSPKARTGDGPAQGPVSPENKECCPPRGKCKSKDCTHIKGTPPLSEYQKEEQITELDAIAAETLIVISCCGAHNRLSWFAEVVSTTGDNLESEIAKIENDAGCANQNRCGLFLASAKNDKAKGSLSIGFSPPECKDIWEIGGCPETRLSRRVVKKACTKSRRCSSDRVKKSISSILKQPSSLNKQGDLGSWGRIKRREGGLRRRSSKFAVMS